MAVAITFLLLQLLSTTCVSVEIPSTDNYEDDNKPIPTIKIEALVGRSTSLPCNVQPANASDMFLVLWYQELAGRPIYSFDRRNDKISGKHWSAPVPFGKRAVFQDRKNSPALIITDVKKEDGGIYRCRVDFENSPTKNFKVQLYVIVPPSSPRIRVQSRQRSNLHISNGVIGPVLEGDELNLVCDSVGGQPMPSLIWFLDGEAIDSSYTYEQRDTVVNKLNSFKIQREHDGRFLECRANNTAIGNPRSRKLVLELHLKPKSVKIEGEGSVTNNVPFTFRCTIEGSKPEAAISWYIGQTRISPRFSKDIHVRTSDYQISELTYTPKSGEDGRNLVCRARNPLVRDYVIEDRLRLRIKYAPKVRMNIGSSLRLNDIRKGSDAYFECHVTSNPQEGEVFWFKNGKRIVQDRSRGKIIQPRSLVLQNIQSSDAGNYTCSARNSVGTTVSNSIEMKVKYPPLCVSPRTTVMAAVGEEIDAFCDVKSFPKPIKYVWWPENGDIQGNKKVVVTEFNTLRFKVRSQKGLSKIYCKGQNDIGDQEAPCEIRIEPGALMPTKLLNCSAEVAGDVDLKVSCVSKGRSHSSQIYVLEVYDKHGVKVASLPPSKEPTFVLDAYQVKDGPSVKILSKNVRGVSRPFRLHLDKFSMEESGSGSLGESNTLLMVVILVCSTIALLILLTAIRKFFRHCSKK